MPDIKKYRKAKDDKISGKLLDFLETAATLTGSPPKLTMVGNAKLCIEGGGEIIEYQSDKLKLALKKGYLTISGENLIIVAASGEDLLLEGLIQRLEFS